MAKKEQEAQQQKQQEDQMAQQEQQATVGMMEAQREKDMALSSKYQSNVKSSQFDMMYKTAETKREEQKVNIDAIKALDALNGIDISKIKELIELSRLLQEERDNQGIEETLDNQEIEETLANQVPMQQAGMPQDQQGMSPEQMDPQQMELQQLMAQQGQMQGEPEQMQGEPGLEDQPMPEQDMLG